MKLARIVCTALALCLIAGLVTWVYACDNSKATAAAAASKAGVCTAEMAAKCTPEMMAACKASLAAGGPDLCLRRKGTAAVAAAGTDHRAAMKASAVTAAANGASGTKGTNATAAVAAAGSDHCAAMKASAVTAAANGASGTKGTNATAAVAAAGSDHCAAMKASAVTAAANGACGTKGAATTVANGTYNTKGAIVVAGAGYCGMASMAGTNARADCEACLDMADCSGALDAAGAHRQAVRLKNGIMYVYTADSPRNVSAVQAAVARRGDRMTRLVSAGEKARLCAECKTMRGAMASGKLNREIVNIEGGSLTLITSSDPTVVAKIHAMTDLKPTSRTKS